MYLDWCGFFEIPIDFYPVVIEKLKELDDSQCLLLKNDYL